MSWTPEPTLASRWPHNSVLERDIRSIQEVTRAVHFQAGFAIRPGLWAHSAVFATFVLNLEHNLAAREETRYVAATGAEFLGRRLLLGQLVFYRVDPRQKFCGYRLDAGPESFKGVYLVLSYKKVKDGSPGFDMAVPVPFEELFVPDGEPVLLCCLCEPHSTWLWKTSPNQNSRTSKALKFHSVRLALNPSI